MRAGRLRHRVKIQAPVSTQDEYGGTAGSWTDVATVDAGIHPMSGRELLAAQAIQSSVTHEIAMRYRVVDATNRILYGARIFNIKSVVNIDERNRDLVLLCTEGLDRG